MFILLIWFCSLLSCKSEPLTEVQGVWWAGCTGTRAVAGLSRVCLIPEEGRTLRLWMPVRTGLRAELDGAPLTITERSSREYPDGGHVEVTVSQANRRLVLTDGHRREWVLHISPESPCAATQVLNPQTNERCKSGDAVLLQQLDGARAECEASGHAADAWRIASASTCDNSGALDRSYRLLSELESRPIPGHFESAYYVNFMAGQVLESNGDLGKALLVSELSLDLARGVGDLLSLGEALQLRAEVLESSGKLLEAHALRMEAQCLPLEQHSKAGLLRLTVLSDLAWGQVLGQELGIPLPAPECASVGLGRPQGPLHTLRWLVVQPELSVGAAGQPPIFANLATHARVNWALAALLQGDAEEAQTALEDLDRLFLLPDWQAPQPGRSDAFQEQRIWRELLWGRLLLLRGDPSQALVRLRAALRMAQGGQGPGQHAWPDAELWAHTWLIRAHLAQGDDEAAQTAQDEALRRAKSQWLKAPLQLQGADFSRNVEPLYRLAMDRALERGDTQGAFMHLRELRRLDLARLRIDEGVGERLVSLRRQISGLSLAPPDESQPEQAQREAQQRALTAEMNEEIQRLSGLSSLRPESWVQAPSPGELWVSWVQGDQGWYALTWDAAGVRRWPLSGLDLGELPEDPAALSEALLTPLREPIDAAQTVHLMPLGPLHGVALHALPLAWAQGRSLASHRAAVYWLDLPPKEQAPGEERLFLMADSPSEAQVGQLSGGPDAVARMNKLGFEAHRCGDASSTRFLEELQKPGALFFIGHVECGEASTSPCLILCDGPVPLQSLLTTPVRRRTVMLGACRSSVADPGLGERLGLAQALLLAGAEEVIASLQDVPPAHAILLAQTLGEQLQQGQAGPAAWLGAVRALENEPGFDLRLFRVLLR